MKKINLSDSIKEIFANTEEPAKNKLPLYISRVAAGFPSPADDYLESRLDLNEYLIKSPSSTFFVRVSGDSMIGAGIHDNDLLIVDRSLDVKNNSIVIAALNGELTVKRFRRRKTEAFLLPENENYPEIPLNEDMELEFWGVAVHVIHSLV